MRALDRTSLVAGVVLVVLGTVFLLDRTGSFDVSFDALWPLLTGAAGAILLAAGLDDRRHP
jgi:hypothetical protein